MKNIELKPLLTLHDYRQLVIDLELSDYVEINPAQFVTKEELKNQNHNAIRIRINVNWYNFNRKKKINQLKEYIYLYKIIGTEIKYY